MSIECKSISKTFHNRRLFHDISVIFPQGICNCVIGENGTGKTTLLKIIAGLIKADAGTIIMKGNCNYAGSNPYMLRGTVFENINYPLTLKRQGGKSNENQVNQMIDRLGLNKQKHQEACTLSAGEKQKVVLGRALVWNPDVLLLDEPTTNIDQKMIASVEELLMEYADNSSHTFVVVSHDHEQIKRFSGLQWHLVDQRLVKK